MNLINSDGYEKISKKMRKPLDKPHGMWYNKYVIKGDGL